MATSFDIATTACAVIGGVLAPVGVATHFIIRYRENRAFRPPTDQKLLRPPGYSLMNRLDAVWDQALIDAVCLAGCGAYAGVIGRFLAPLGWHLVVGSLPFSELARHVEATLTIFCAALGALLGIVFFGVRSHRALREARSLRLGLRGEQIVGEVLSDEAVVRAGYRSFHDVPGDGAWNVDHVVVGPGGVFVLETKARSKRKGARRAQQAPHEVVCDGAVLRFPDWDDTETIPQAERNAAWIEKEAGKHATKAVVVTPVVVIPGWWITLATRNLDRAKVINTTVLARFLTGQPRRYTPEDLAPIIASLDAKCRTLEF